MLLYIQMGSWIYKSESQGQRYKLGSRWHINNIQSHETRYNQLRHEQNREGNWGTEHWGVPTYNGGEEMGQAAEEMDRDLPSEGNKSQENLLSQKPSREIVISHKKKPPSHPVDDDWELTVGFGKTLPSLSGARSTVGVGNTRKQTNCSAWLKSFVFYKVNTFLEIGWRWNKELSLCSQGKKPGGDVHLGGGKITKIQKT